MAVALTGLPFLTAYDPPGVSEGTLDPLGLYQIADQLAVKLVPAVRERMQRVRFLTAMAVGAIVAEGIDSDPTVRDAEPCLAWEWLVVEATVRSPRENGELWGMPGTLVTRRALDQRGYLDARSYLKTPRVFGFNGVYKRLAVHLGLVDGHLAPGPKAEGLVDVWARGLDLGGLSGARPLLARWSEALRRSVAEKPPRTKANWTGAAWEELAGALAPDAARAREKRFLRDLLLAADERRLGAFSSLWALQDELEDDNYKDEALHALLNAREPQYGPLLEAIRAYEAFARSLQDAFDLLLAEAAGPDARGYTVPRIVADRGFAEIASGLQQQWRTVYSAFGEWALTTLSIQGLFGERFAVFGEPLDPGAFALALCTHHEEVQDNKSAEGKRPWFDRLGPDRIYVRHGYRTERKDRQSDRYLHEYRGAPIRRFWKDLA
jgi:hypothetical protein